jgi:hypothetical protein
MTSQPKILTLLGHFHSPMIQHCQEINKHAVDIESYLNRLQKVCANETVEFHLQTATQNSTAAAKPRTTFYC